jgi:hypothetical protein
MCGISGRANWIKVVDMCVDFEPDFSFTENVCEYCKLGDKLDEWGDTGHDDCNEITEEACACRNSDHMLGDPVAFQERFYAEFAKAKEAMHS